jgi:hypothetical protein
MKSISTFPIFSLVAVSFAGMAVFAVIDQAQAGKGITASGSGTYKMGPIAAGGVKKLPATGTTGTAKANPPRIRPPIFEDGSHRGVHGDEKVFAPPQLSRKGIVRDHRRHPAPALPPRVVPKEDPPQKW